MPRFSLTDLELSYSQDFLESMNAAPTVFHWVADASRRLSKAGFEYLPEREPWHRDGLIHAGGKYYTTRNGSSLLAFKIPQKFDPDLPESSVCGVGLVGCHIDANSLRVKPISKKADIDGYSLLGAASYGSANMSTWWDRDLGLGGRVIVRIPDHTGAGNSLPRASSYKFEQRLILLDGPIARIPTLAEHFGKPADGPFNPETQMTPVIGQDSLDDGEATDDERKCPLFGKHNLALIRAIASKLDVRASQIVQWELELFDTHEGTLSGLSKELLVCPRLDDKLCSFAALQALIESPPHENALNMVALFDNEEIGSRTKQGAKGGLLQATIDRIFAGVSKGFLPKLYANSFFVSSDVTHAVNPNFSDVYLEHHKPRLNTGMVVKLDANGHTTSDGISTAFIEEVARRSNNIVQYFHVRNGTPSGGTIGPMLSTATGMRAVDLGIPQLSMHSVRATTGSKDVLLGIQMFKGFFAHWAAVDSILKTN